VGVRGVGGDGRLRGRSSRRLRMSRKCRGPDSIRCGTYNAGIGVFAVELTMHCAVQA
jgi:hypothetical protein